jgi:hypothetical protein
MTMRKQWRVTVRFRLKTKSYWSRDRRLLIVASSPASAAATAVRDTQRRNVPKRKRVEEWALACSFHAQVDPSTPLVRDVTEAVATPPSEGRSPTAAARLSRGGPRQRTLLC